MLYYYQKKLEKITPKSVLFLSEKPSTTPSKRNYKFLKKHLYLKKNNYLKSKVFFQKKQIGKTVNGQMVSFYKSTGFCKLYREIENIRYPLLHMGMVEQLEYNPNHSALLARIFNGFLNYHFYIRAIDGLQIGDYITTFDKYSADLGDSCGLLLKFIGKPIHNITLQNSNNIARSAGTFAVVLQKYVNYCLVRFPSQKMYYVLSKSQATNGKICNFQHKLINLGKAGRNRWLGKCSHVRGVAMNPIDHPHGGGQGKTSGGHSTSVSPWGKPTKQMKKKKKLNFAKNHAKIHLKKEING